jgi:undecaprenyl phosphate N,N'-diacetylbacillosamine 1-phosphate transferase
MVYRKIGKRILDFFLSLAVIMMLAPVYAIISLLLYVNNGSVFFYQERPGKNEKPFKIIKFKSMNDKRDAEGKLLPDIQRITKVGAFIRKTSMDELPQLFNVLKGDMSLIGPRPLLFKYIPLYQNEQRKRHDVRPGITGWAQVNGRNSIRWTEKFKFDVYYVENISFLFDIKILWMTFLKVVKREGVNQSADQPMQPFNGFN